MTNIIGIDLGTYYSVVSHWKHGRVSIIPAENGSNLTPSIVLEEMKCL